MRSADIFALVLTLLAAGLFLTLPAEKQAQTLSRGSKATVVFGVS